MRWFYVVASLIQGVKRISCPLCNGIGWSIHRQWKLKCILCDAEGWAVLSDCLDYYTHIEPDVQKVKLLEEKQTPQSEVDEDEDCEKGDDTEFTMEPSESEGSYTV